MQDVYENVNGPVKYNTNNVLQHPNVLPRMSIIVKENCRDRKADNVFLCYELLTAFTQYLVSEGILAELTCWTCNIRTPVEL